MCEKFEKKECKGGFWCGICPLKEYSGGYHCTPGDAESFAMKAQQEFFKRYMHYVKEGEAEKAKSYYSCIQIMEKMLEQ